MRRQSRQRVRRLRRVPQLEHNLRFRLVVRRRRTVSRVRLRDGFCLEVRLDHAEDALYELLEPPVVDAGVSVVEGMEALGVGVGEHVGGGGVGGVGDGVQDGGGEDAVERVGGADAQEEILAALDGRDLRRGLREEGFLGLVDVRVLEELRERG